MKLFVQLIVFVSLTLSANAQKKWRLYDMKVDVKENYNDVFFATDDVGFIVGDSGLVLETRDGGKSWSKRTDFDKSFGNIRSVLFETDSIGYLNTEDAVHKTLDMGKTWVHNGFNIYRNFIDIYKGDMYNYGDAGFGSFALSIHSAEYDTIAYHFGFFPMYSLERAKLTGDSTIVVIQDTGRVYYSTDLGKSIQRVFSPQDYGFVDAFSQSIEFINSDTGFITYNQNLQLMTIDGGQSWTVDTSLKVENIIEPSTGVLSLVDDELYRCYPRISWFYREYVVEKFNRVTSAWDHLYKEVDGFGMEGYRNKGHLHGTSKTLFTPLNNLMLYYSEDSITSSIWNVSNENFKLYPNPSTGKVVIDLAEVKGVELLQVHDLRGVLIQEMKDLRGVKQYILEVDYIGACILTLVDEEGRKYSKKLLIH
ncbi:MAG: hypothetical protein COA58_10640 [Bacteroidetes bacterium]|nr:MAG: hypothetical protein COA58_10640 [Bacteroidota bacterium]